MSKFEIKDYAFPDEPTPDGLGIFVNQKNLYHTPLHPSQPITARPSLHLLSEEEIAIHYAKTKFSPHQPVISEARIKNLKLVDFRKKENAKIFLSGYKVHLNRRLENEKLNWLEEISMKTALENITPEKISSGHYAELVTSLGRHFREYCESLGYAGLITFESTDRPDAPHHDAFIIFNPVDVRITQEKILKS